MDFIEFGHLFDSPSREWTFAAAAFRGNREIGISNLMVSMHSPHSQGSVYADVSRR